MKFKFSLEKVLQHRKQLEVLAQKDFSEAMAVLNQEREVLNTLVESQKVARERAFQLQTTDSNSIESLKQIHHFSKGQDLRIKKQLEKIQEQETLVENLREVLRERLQEYKIIESLRQKKFEEHKSAERKLEQKRIDDIVIMRANRDRG